VIRLGVGVDVFLEQFAGEADDGKQNHTRDEAEEARTKGDRGILGNCDCVCHFVLTLDSLAVGKASSARK
jgi:hypothetical protein